MDTEKDTDRYPFKVNRRYQGIALVISNFTSGPYMRKGADIDLKYMKKTFKRLGFKVDCHENLTTSKFVSLLNSYSKDKSLNAYDCFVFAISSHGIEREVKKKDQVVHHHAIQMFDDEYFDTQEVLDHFSPKACKALKNKPKLFFIQACRIPESKATEDHRDAGIGFDHGTRHRDGGGEPGQNKHGRDKIDHQETKEISDEESDLDEADVSDKDSNLEGDNDLPTTKSQDTDTEGACRIPESKATEDHRDAGIGFDHGTRHRHGGGEPGQNKHGRDKIDHQEDKEISDEESDTEEVDVSDTDIDEDSDLEGDNDLPTTKSQDTDTEGEQDTPDVEKYLEQRQREIVRNLKKLQNEVWQLGRVYTQEANHNKETDTHTAAGRKGALSPEIEQKDDELDPARGIRLQPSAEKGMPGDEVDPPRARRYRPTVAPIHITAVPCHNDMLVMFASPQGLYAFRSKDIGSYMLRFLYKAVEKFYGNGKLKDNNTNFLEVLREITAQMSSRTFFGEKEYTNVPCTLHKLSKDIIFTQRKNMADSKFSKKLSSILTTFFANWK